MTLTAPKYLKPSTARPMFKIKKTLITLGIWLLSQIIALIFFPSTDAMMAPMLLTSEAAVIIILWIIKYYKMADLVKGVPLKVFLASLILGYASLYAIEIIQSQFDIPNIMEDAFDTLIHSVCGFFAICLIGPVTEELMLRRIILTDMHQATGKRWMAIIISAILFSIMHGNPIQMVFALPAGILFGWLYCKTGSLMVPLAVHIMNNTISFFTMRAGDDQVMEISDPYTIACLAAAILVTVSLIVWLVGFYRRTEE